ncbi:MAG: glycosyltransferase [Verrucomicrobiota bacterium]
MNPFVVVVVATWRRASELARLLASLTQVQMPLAVLVVDNADDAATQSAVDAAHGRLPVERLVPGTNLGCGGGLAYGEQVALHRFPQATHFWLLDDDTEVCVGALEGLVSAMTAEGADIGCPMITNAQGEIGWFPGLLERKAFRVIRTAPTPAAYQAQCGDHPVRFSWATGVSLLVTRAALEACGGHRADFWIRGEDLDFTLRLTFRGIGVFVPGAQIKHLPAPSAEDPAERHKHALMLQNIAYISLHLPHGRRILPTLPGNVWRYLKTWGPRGIGALMNALWRGGVLRQPGGVGR